MGRPKGQLQVDDPTLVKVLHEHTTERGQWSLRHGRELRSLLSPIREVIKQCEFLRLRVSYRWLASRLQSGRLGITRPYRKVDCCATCRCWDAKVKGELVAAQVLV
jgi:hypothetical protein